MGFWEAVFVRCWPLSETCAVDWAAWGTIVGAAVGFVTVLVAVLAWKTSDRATEIAKRAADIALQQHDEIVSLRSDNARILGQLLLSELTVFPARVHHISRAWKAAIQWDGDLRIVNGTAFASALEESQKALLSTLDQVQERLHNLPVPLGPDLAGLLGMSKELNVAASDTSARVQKDVFGNDGLPLYAGKFSDFMYLRRCLEMTQKAAVKAAVDVRRFAGAQPVDYDATGASTSPWS